MLYRRTDTGMIDGRIVQAHKKCMSVGEALAKEQGMVWRTGTGQLDSPPLFPQ